MPLPLVSICLLTYNRSPKLSGTLDSLLNQNYPHFELIINDDCSTDETGRISLEYALRDKRVKYFKNAHNLRYAGNQNAAVLRSSGEFIALVHDGDNYDASLIQKWTNALLNNPTAAIVFNGYEYISNGRKIVLPLSSCSRGMHLAELFFGFGYSPIWGIAMVRRCCIEAVGPFDERFRNIADVDMWLRLIARFDCAYVSEVLIRIDGREEGHENNAFNWRIHAQSDYVFWLNARRMYAEEVNFRAILRQVDYSIWRRNIMCLLWSVRSAKAVSFFGAIKHFFTHSSRRRSALSAWDTSPRTWREAADLVAVPLPQRLEVLALCLAESVSN